MIEQLSDSGCTVGGTGDSSLPSNDKQLPVAVKKQALRDLPNENNVTTTKLTSNSLILKERGPVTDSDKVSGTKRPASEVNPPPSQASCAVSANGNLVYVRRKTEADVGKVSTSVSTSNNADLQLSVKATVSNERVHPSSAPDKLQVEACDTISSSEPSPHPNSGMIMPPVEDKSPLPHPVGKSGNTMLSTENKSPLPHPLGKPDNTISSTVNKSPLLHPIGKPGNNMSPSENRSPLPHPLGKPGNSISSVENYHIPPDSTKYLQQRHTQPLMLFRGLDRSGHEEYLQILRSLSSAELSRLAFELETRSIQLSLEEAKEMARVEILNVMGKSTKTYKLPPTQPQK